MTGNVGPWHGCVPDRTDDDGVIRCMCGARFTPAECERAARHFGGDVLRDAAGRPVGIKLHPTRPGAPV